MREDHPELSFYLPTGEDLRVFLNQETITVTLLRQLLRSRGILCPSQDKKDLLPFFLLSYLTPDEFEILLEAVRTKEEAHKIRSHSFSVPFEGASLADAIPKNINYHEVCADQYGNYEVVNSPMLEADPEEGKPSFIVRIKTKRTILSADLSTSSRVFDSSVRYTHDAKKKCLVITTNHTSNETHRVNDRVVSVINKHLKDQNFISPETEFRVRFDSFNNEERIRFFMQFTALNDWTGASFDRLKELSLKLDEKSDPPEREGLTWMKNKVNRVNLRGKALERTFFIDDPTCRPFVIFWRMEMRFTFLTLDHDGHFDVVLEFADYALNELGSSEFQVYVDGVHIKGVSEHNSFCREIRERFNKKFIELKQEAYDKVKASLPSDPVRS